MANIYAPDRDDRLDPAALELLLSGIKIILKSGLAVNFDLHSISQKTGGSNYSGPLGQDEKFTAEFINFWQHLAEKLAIFDPDWLLIEPMNEPVFLLEEYKWPPIQKQLLQAIREKCLTTLCWRLAPCGLIYRGCSAFSRLMTLMSGIIFIL